MARSVPYVMCRYQMTMNDNPMSSSEQFEFLQQVRGTLVSHRKSEPNIGNADTLVMRPKKLKVGRYNVLTWDVGQELSGRSEAKYDRDNDEVQHVWSDGEAVRYATFVAVPRLGAVAVNDRLSDIFLGAAAGVARFKTIVRNTVDGADITITQSATHADSRKAIATWTLDRFEYVVRPFNPHPRDPGRILSEIMARDNIGVLQGKAIPAAGRRMESNEDGYIEEVVGLSTAGYGQFGMRGRTPEGREVALKKPKFDLDKDKNESAQASPHQLRVFLDQQQNEQDEHIEAAKTLIEFYEDKSA